MALSLSGKLVNKLQEEGRMRLLQAWMMEQVVEVMEVNLLLDEVVVPVLGDGVVGDQVLRL